MLQLNLALTLHLVNHALVLFIQLDIGHFGLMQHLFVCHLLLSEAVVASLVVVRQPGQLYLQVLLVLLQLVYLHLQLLCLLVLLQLHLN